MLSFYPPATSQRQSMALSSAHRFSRAGKMKNWYRPSPLLSHLPPEQHIGYVADMVSLALASFACFDVRYADKVMLRLISIRAHVPRHIRN